MTTEQRERLEDMTAPLARGLSTLDKIAIRAALDRIETLKEALTKTAEWVNLQGNHPGCRDAADCMLAVIRKALGEPDGKEK